jgi:small GTP-binding protein
LIIKKIMLLGEMAVGKTSIARCLAFDRFETSYKSTVGVDIYRYDVEPAPDGRRFQFLIWDTDGNASDAMFRDPHMRGADAAVIIGDLTRRETLEAQLKLVDRFSDSLPGRYFSAVLNKTDLTEEIPEDENYVPKGLRDQSFPIYRTSAKSGSNIKSTFQAAARTIVNRENAAR